MVSATIDLPELAVGETMTIEVAGRNILLCRSHLGVHATATLCPHQAKLLEGGRIRGQSIMCPHHGARFDLVTGKSLSPQLTPQPLPLFSCIEQDGQLVVDIERQPMRGATGQLP